VLEQLYAIVNARYEDERAIIITTNLERDELAEQINERTVSRLEEMCEVLPLWGADARQQRPDARLA
jgi:DNA replication protein DnaC